MAIIIEYMRNVNDFLDKHGDPRLSKWPLMSTPFYTLGICLTYVYIAKILGPKLMKYRKPFDLKWTLIIYNLFQVVFNAWMWHTAATTAWFNGYSFRCQPMDYSDHPNTTLLTYAVYSYYISKFIDLFDTLFFIMRKKNSQISTLHVIHHGLMPFSIWFGAKLSPTGHGTFCGFLNAFVHILMYSYYLLSAFGPKVQKYLWWKKYLTTIQMIQFVMVMVHSFQLYFVECDYPRLFADILLLHAVLFFFLFKQFYNEEYTKKNSLINHPEKNRGVTNISTREEGYRKRVQN